MVNWAMDLLVTVQHQSPLAISALLLHYRIGEAINFTVLCFQEEQSNAGELMTKVSWEMAAQYLMLILLILNLFTWSGLVSEIEISKLDLTFWEPQGLLAIL